jgi:hypothetical protein
MPAHLQPSPRLSASIDRAPGWIGLGLTLVLCSFAWPLAPVGSGLAFVALGATQAMQARLQQAQVSAAWLVVHTLVYASLYALFVGAALHAALPAGLGVWRAFDLAASAVLMTIIVRRVILELGQR